MFGLIACAILLYDLKPDNVLFRPLRRRRAYLKVRAEEESRANSAESHFIFLRSSWSHCAKAIHL